MDEQYVPGKKRIIVASALMIGLGAAEIVVGSFVIQDSSGYYAGAVYTGVICLFAGIHGISHGAACTTNASRLKWTACLALFAVFASIIGAALQGVYFFFVRDLETCVDNHQNCYGSCDTYYKSFATNCATSSKNTNCNCVASSCKQGSCTCYTYTKLNACKAFVEDENNFTFISFVLCLLCTVMSLGLLILSTYSLYLLSAATTEVFTTINTGGEEEGNLSINEKII